MDHRELLQQIKVRLQEVFGGRLRGVVLYGSEARGVAREDSDIDVLMLLVAIRRLDAGTTEHSQFARWDLLEIHRSGYG